MNNWVLLNPSKFITSQNKMGLNLHVTFSPYDIPSAIRGCFTSDNKKCVIEFKYLTDEPTHRREVGSQVIAVLGDHSQRLYGFDVDIDAAKVEDVQLQCKVQEAIKGAFQGLRAGHLSPTLADRYRLAEEVISENSDRLFTVSA